jgi:uncharacterized protein
MDNVLKKEIERAKSQKKILNQIFSKISELSSKEMDTFFHEEHEEVFNNLDCLSCANCCSTTSPIFRDVDIKRISKKLQLKPSKFIDEYLYLDNDDDYVLKSSPCPFLGEGNKCDIYSIRPQACAEYPHTNRKKMNQLLTITRLNTEVCPAVYRIVKKFEN